MTTSTVVKKLSMAAAGAAFIALGSMPSAAHATTITFDDPVSNSVVNQPFNNFSVDGFTFNNNGFYSAIWNSTSPNSNGTNNLIFAGFFSGDYLSITKIGGGSFNLKSLDMSISWYDVNPSENILINGSPITIVQGIQTYNLNLNNVSQVNITGVPSLSGYWLVDNVNVTPVPEPFTILGAATAVGFGGFFKKRLKKQLTDKSDIG